MNHILVRRIRPEDNLAMSGIIRTVMTEYGAGGRGFAIHDDEVNDMYAAYSRPRSAFFVCTIGGELIGGGGIAPLAGGDENTCELKKMYFIPSGRRKGLGQRVLQKCLGVATEYGFRYCYLETFNTMKEAMKLYEKNGFIKIPGPLGNTGHFACDTFYQLELKALLVADTQ